MAKLEERSAREDLKKNGPKPLYYLYGEDQYKVQEFVSHLTDGATPETYFGDELEPAAFLDSVRTRSLWSPGGKVVVVRGADSISAKKWEGLSDLWDDDDSDSVVIFTAVKADARTKHVQAFSKKKSAALVKFDPPDEGEAGRWAVQFAKQQGKTLADDAKRLLISWAGGSLFDLLHDVQKAALFAGGANEISREHVERVGIRIREESIFPVMDAVLNGSQKEALAGIAALLAQREEPLGMVALLAKQYGTILRILALRGEGLGDAEIQQELKLHPFVAKKLLETGKRLGAYRVLGALAALADADFTLKSSREPADLVLTRTLLRIMNKEK